MLYPLSYQGTSAGGYRLPRRLSQKPAWLSQVGEQRVRKPVLYPLSYESAKEG